MNGGGRIAATLLVLVASGRIISTYKVLSHTTDEPAHLAAGMEWLENGSYTYENQHPPLARVLGAIGLHFAGSRWSHGLSMYDEGFHLLGFNHRYTHNLFYARAAMLPLFWLASTVVYLWSARIAGPRSALLSTLLFTTIPPVLGHAGLATTDMAVTAFTGAAVLSALCWFDKPDWKRSLLLGSMTACALLSKFSAVAFLPAAFVCMGAAHVLRNRPTPGGAVKFVLPVALAAIAAVVVIGSVYRFDGRAFFGGISAVWEHNREGHLAYLLGARSTSGFWDYYPVVLAVKTPLALLILSAIALRRTRDIAMPLAFSAAILIVGFTSHINIGIRHILPVYIGLSICGGVAALRLWQTSRPLFQGALIALLAWQAISGALQGPEYIAYTNELAGSHPERILADSDLDWSQDMKLLAGRLRQLGVHEFTFKSNSLGYIAAGNEFPRITFMPDGNIPRPGWNAVSITPWKLSGEPRWAEKAAPKERIGRGILLYYF